MNWKQVRLTDPERYQQELERQREYYRRQPSRRRDKKQRYLAKDPDRVRRNREQNREWSTLNRDRRKLQKRDRRWLGVRRLGEKAHPRLSFEIVKTIRARVAAGRHRGVQAALARAYGVSARMISKIVLGQAWRAPAGRAPDRIGEAISDAQWTRITNNKGGK